MSVPDLDVSSSQVVLDGDTGHPKAAPQPTLPSFREGATLHLVRLRILTTTALCSCRHLPFDCPALAAPRAIPTLPLTGPSTRHQPGGSLCTLLLPLADAALRPRRADMPSLY